MDKEKVLGNQSSKFRKVIKNDRGEQAIFENSRFIKPDVIFEKGNKSYAPMFRKIFSLDRSVHHAVLHVCGLGIGYFYINGELVTEDLFIAPLSDYAKTLWFNSYDVTDKVRKGNNLFAAVCGNGWYNEGLPSAWDFDKASWRDTPKLIAALEADGQTVLVTDGSWKCFCDPAVLYNQLRSGEYFDSRLYDENWISDTFLDDSWNYAKEDENPPKGVFRECTCEPIRKCEILSPVNIIQTGDKKYVFDFGKNISGYIRLTVDQASGDEVMIEYAEQISEEGSRCLNDMDTYYYDSAFQTDRFICCGKPFTWSPRFVYHGFRYAVITGIRDIHAVEVRAVFVHQDIRIRSNFSCSDERINKLFEMGQNATLSNLFYAPTDCPTREKLGWMNDAQASVHQMLTDFETERLFEKWFTDICDAMKEDGSLPGIVPTAGWGYEWGNGPVSDGCLFEIPYRIYLHTGSDALLKKGLPYFEKYLQYLASRENEMGELDRGLDDWAAPVNEDKVDAAFINGLLRIKFLKITALARERCQITNEDLMSRIASEKKRIINRYIENGRCIINKQTAVAMLIYFEVYEKQEPLKQQLKELVESKNYHHDCGMVGLRYLYTALNICGFQELAFRIICSEGYPSYMDWLKDGGTSLYERWDMTESKNHHMYSHFMAWLVNTILGIKPDIRYPGFKKIVIDPFFPEGLTYATGSCNTVNGRVTVAWERTDDAVKMQIDVSEGMEVCYKDAQRTVCEQVADGGKRYIIVI